MSNELQIGLIGLDTSHVPAFCKLLNDRQSEYSVSGARITAGFPGASPDFALSIDRVEKFTEEIQNDYGVEILDAPQAVAQKCDAVFITSVDGRAHRGFFEQIAPLKKPTFIDKPFAVSSEDAHAMIALAEEYSVALMSCSSLRYAQPVVDALEKTPRDTIAGIDVSGPMQLEETQNDLFWYAIHCAELLFTVMGAGCKEVFAANSENFECITGVWGDGRVATLRGDHAAEMPFGLTLHTSEGAQLIKPYEHPKPAYAGMLERVIPFLSGGSTAVPLSETLEIIRFLEAANQSRKSGKSVAL